MQVETIIFLLLLPATLFISFVKQKLTVGGTIAAAFIGTLIYAGAGFAGIAMIGVFFLAGIWATSWKHNLKETIGAAEADKGKRNASQVLANGGLAAIAGLMILFFPAYSNLFNLVMASALSSATADTLSSELGIVYGSSCYNILDLKKGTKGENGVVSKEGTLIGIAGSLLMATVYSAAFGWHSTSFAIILIAGFMGNIADSLLGATLEKKNLIKNNTVNFLNTATAAIAALVMYEVW